MKWVKVAIGAVIAIISIGIIATSVHSMTQEKVRQEVVTFEVLEDPNITSGTYNLLIDFIDYDNVTFKVNNNIVGLDEELPIYLEDDYVVISNINGEMFIINSDDTYIDDDALFDINDTFEITFKVTTPAQLTGISATLILLTPLIFAGGILAYLLNKQNY